ncbi:hypothetical protein PIB30_068496 [Stylosanthes scabra]|uniref:Uncharacterized protein n=1 Tax=Stylosanthes scabra TaxID=79078 RepID=A0ABU6UNX3_9FABA|nr:hypothetical protein [Stylosanthes scabra]
MPSGHLLQLLEPEIHINEDLMESLTLQEKREWFESSYSPVFETDPVTQQRKSNETEIETLREEYHQKVATLERRVYALTKERDTLPHEQNKKKVMQLLS